MESSESNKISIIDYRKILTITLRVKQIIDFSLENKSIKYINAYS